ncbi:F-box/LRR-repeat protein 4 [Eurytemora carolleeae]|uniref:F-box/LRR-repeat protein 4 n=1 Tax=Eurytemora carolleeae TaxID=1294199 RepID=UPI000C77686B|nr:F-box/LRR-repeat protein 4 [Eurytemora carolleeae]XP_023324561.1 F-box/LRR-repeat protein 4 [Eurytemora carolleeae]|eukprot:XP_023324560.1 F-box/LRR-repeat protein 4-like [Eurytemora affinis]
MSEDYSYILVEQYATEVLDFSSQYGSDNSISYTAHNITGMPSKFPSYGDFSQTYVMRDYGPWWKDCPSGKVWRKPFNSPKSNIKPPDNFIDIKYEHCVYPIRIHVYETYNPGGITAIWAGNCQGNWKLLWGISSSKENQDVSQRPRIFSPPLQQTSFPTKLLRLEFEQTHLLYYTEIDAVALLGTLSPVSTEARIGAMLPENMGEIMKTIVKRKLHILPQDTDKIIYNCATMLNKRSLQAFQSRLEERERNPGDSNLGLFDRLPREIMLHILSYLDLITLVQISGVSTLFREFVSDPYLYTSLDLKDIFYCASSQTLSWLETRCSALVELDLSWCGNYGKIKPSALQQFIETTGHTLNSIRLDNCHVATVSVLNTIVSFSPNLKRLSLGNCHLLTLPDFHLLSQLENLVSLNLYRTSVGQTSIITILCNNRKLKHLCLAGCQNIDGDEVCIVLSHCQLDLECLDLWRCSTLSDRGIASLSLCTKLRDLDIGWCLSIPGGTGALVHLIESCPGLERLYLTAHRQTGNRELKALCKLKNLKQLDILGNRNITFSALQELVSFVPSLQLVDASFCTQLEEAEVRQLRQDFPNLTIKWSFIDVQ